MNSKKLIPEPSYFIRFSHLTKEQKIEFASSFKPPVQIGMIKKYKEIRKISYLLLLFNDYDNYPFDKILKECKLLAEVTNDKEFLIIPKFYDYLNSLSYDERVVKLELLNELDSEEPDTLGIVVQSFESSRTIYYKRIYANENYYEFITASLEELEVFKKTGIPPFNYNSDMEKIMNLKEKSSGKLYENVYSLTDPNKIIEISVPYIEACLELGEKLNPKNTRWLNIGHAIDKLTVNYVKIKDWQNVKNWLEILFSLPNNYLKHSLESELEAMRKRLIRANKYV